MIDYQDAEALRNGTPPESVRILKEISSGSDSLTDFIRERYLKDYIASGGSKIKFLTGRKGSGKTHISRLIEADAAGQNYICVRFSAKDVWLHDFREIYLEILKQCDIRNILTHTAKRIIEEMGYNPSEMKEGQNFMDLLSEKGEADALAKGEIRGLLRKYFTKNPLMDNNFAACCSLITGGILGHPLLEDTAADLILRFLHGDKTVKLSQMRALGLSPARISKYNARHLLRSLSETVHLAGYKGLLIVIDDMEKLLDRSSESPIRYTKLRRDDTYESIRQLIDDIDNMHHVMFLFCFDRELMDNENYGIKSYQALWMRIQNEVVSSRFNCFADIIDMDRYADEHYTEEIIQQMGMRMAAVLEGSGIKVHSLNKEMIDDIIKRSYFGGLGLPFMVNRAITEEVE